MLWDRCIVTLDDLSLDRALDIGAFFHAASDVRRRLSDFIHQVVVYRRDEAIRGVAKLGSGGSSCTPV